MVSSILSRSFIAQEWAQGLDYVRSLLAQPMKEQIYVDYHFILLSYLGEDWFDYHRLNPSELAIYLIDAASHGISSTLLSISILNLL